MEINGSTIMLVYSDDIIQLVDTKIKKINTTEKLIASNRRMGLFINEHNTKHLVMAIITPI